LVGRARGAITTALKSKAKVKPSQQTQFLLDVMVAGERKDEKWWERMQEDIDLLKVHLDSLVSFSVSMTKRLKSQ
jgi:hypothetical protein